MTHANKKMILGLLVVVAMTFSMIVTPVAAAQITINEESFERVFEADENGHAYVYAEPTVAELFSGEYLTLEDDLDYERYRYDSNGWSRYANTWTSPGETMVNWHSHDGFTTGIWGMSDILPTFWDLEREINTTVERSSFNLPLGQTSTIGIESETDYTGVLPCGGAEFVHLTIESLQDDVAWGFVIVDSEGTPIIETSGMGGDIIVAPFKPGIGTHYLWFGAQSSMPGVLMFDMHPEAVTPQSIPLGNVVRDTLTSSELTLVDGSVVHTEKAPSVTTYKIRSPNGPAAISYSFNYPEMLPLVSPQPVSITFTSDIITNVFGGQRFVDLSSDPTSDTFFYQSIQGEPYYVTVMGGDNVNYALYNALVEDPELPLNEEFLLQNHNSQTAYKAYGLTVEQDSFMRVNSSVSPGLCDFQIYTVDEDMVFRTFPIGYHDLIQASSVLYMPAGDYVVWATMDGDFLGEFEFNIGPITEDLSASITTIGGFKVPTNAFDYHNFTMLMTNEDNVTATTQFYFFEITAKPVLNTQATLANRWDGSHWMSHPSYDNFTYFELYEFTSDDYTLIAVSPYWVRNNTDGASNDYTNYAVNYTISFDTTTEELADGIDTLNVGNGATHTFDLELPGSTHELYILNLNLTSGVWYNVSVTSEDVSTFNAELYHVIGVRPHVTGWLDLFDNFVGTIGTGFSFEFGAMTENPALAFTVGRDLSTEGNLTITIEPLLTNHLAQLPAPPAPGISLATAGAIGAVVVVGGAIIVVVYLVYTKKLKK